MNTRHNIALLLVACLLIPSFVRAQDAGDPYKAIVSYTVDKSRKETAQIEAEIRKATVAQYRATEARLLNVLKDPDATPDCKNFVCRMLSIVGSAQCVPAVAALLTDEKTSHMARFALEPNADPAAALALRQALTNVKGKLLLGVISSIGARRDPQATDALNALVGDPDQAVARSAIYALGEIGTAESLKALDAAKTKVAPALRQPLANAQIVAARHLADAGKTADAVAVFRSLANAQQPKAVRTAATRGLIATLDKPQAANLVVATMQGDDAALRSAALAAIQDPGEKDLRNTLASQLTTFKPDAQAALLAVLADQQDVTLRDTLLKILDQSQDAQVRAAAIAAFATHGQPGDVATLVKLAAGTNADNAPARRTLERISAAGVDNALIQQADSADSAGKIVVIGAIAARRELKAMDTLVKLMASPDAAVAAEAVKALSTLGAPDQLPKLVAIISETDQPALRSSAENTAKAICSRATDKPAAARIILGALQTAKTAPSRIALLKILSRVPTDQTLAAIRQAMNDTDASVSDAATRELCDWPDVAAAQYLLDLAKSTQNQTYAVLSLRGTLRLAAAAKDTPSAQRLGLYRSVLATAKRPDEKKQALAGLGDLPSVAAMDLVQSYLKDPALGADAANAGIRLARRLGTVDNEKAMAALKEIKAIVTSDDLKKQADDAIAAVEKGSMVDGYIVAWAIAGPYMQEDKDADALFNIAFAPEKPGSNVDWRPIAAGIEGNPGMVGLDKAIGGEQRVAYLRTQITSAKAQEATLELGSDDGAKVWINRKLLHAVNTTRGFQADQDKIKINLNQGVNILLLKITQGGGEWSAGVRLRASNGGDLQGITVSAPVDK